MSFKSWGNYPIIENNSFKYLKTKGLKAFIAENNELIPYGNGRSYGDSALSKNIIHVKHHNYFLGFNETIGILQVQSGVLLAEILDVFIPKGWFLKVTPGTKLITIGGAIASDVHGKKPSC